MNTVKQIIFMDRKTGYLYSDRAMNNQLLCKEHNAPATRALTESILSMYLHAVFVCEKGHHRLKFKVPYEIFVVGGGRGGNGNGKVEYERRETIQERMARRKRGESIKHIYPDDNTEIEEF